MHITRPATVQGLTGIWQQNEMCGTFCYGVQSLRSNTLLGGAAGLKRPSGGPAAGYDLTRPNFYLSTSGLGMSQAGGIYDRCRHRTSILQGP